MSPNSASIRTSASSTDRLSVWSRVSYCQAKASFTPSRIRTGWMRKR